MKRRAIAWGLLFAAWLLALWAPFPVMARRALEVRRPPSPCEGRGITKDEPGRLAKRHGTPAPKMTEDRVFIRRDGRWIPVLDCGGGQLT